VVDLGAAWCDSTGLPLPVGLNVVRRALGRELAQEIALICRESLRWAHNHYDEAFTFASQFGRGCAADHVRMFSNADTLCLPSDARLALRVMFDRVAAMGIGPSVGHFEVIDA
jgi:1,4-dihydroxy-6-naphthoate synthase